MRTPQTIPELARALRIPAGKVLVRGSVRARRVPGRPLVKICGITRAADAEAARALGADALGFVLAPSKRRAEPSLLRDLRDWTFSRLPSWSPRTTAAAGGSTPRCGSSWPGPRRCRSVPRRRDAGRVRGDGISLLQGAADAGPGRRRSDGAATAARGSWPTHGRRTPREARAAESRRSSRGRPGRAGRCGWPAASGRTTSVKSSTGSPPS